MKQLLLCNAVLFLLCLLPFIGSTQDLHHSQFYTSPLNLNPALTGVFNGDIRIVGNYRNQWFVNDLAKYQTLAVNADIKFLPKRNDSRGFWSGGLLFNYDQAGDSKLSMTNLGLSGSYSYALNQNNIVSGGAIVSFNQRRFRTDDLIWDAQWNGDQVDPSIDPMEDFSNTSNLFADFSAGINYRWQRSKRTNINLGAGLFHLAEPNQAFFDDSDDSPLYQRLAISIISSFKLASRVDLLIHGLHQRQHVYEETVVGGYGKFYLNNNRGNELAILLGVGMRLDNALIPKIAVEWKNWYAGFSYDINTPDFENLTNRKGGPEFSLMYRITHVKPLPQFKNCPIF